MAEWGRNLERLKAAYQEWDATKGGSIDTWVALMAENMDLRSLADGRQSLSFTRPRSGRDEAAAYLRDLTTEFTMEYFRADRYVCQDDQIVMIGKTAWINKRTEKHVETPICDVWQFDGGAAVSLFEYYDTAKLAAAAT